MVKISNDILGAIGNTPMIRLQKLAGKNHARILLKLESANPTGSMKDRMAHAMIEAAVRDGRLEPGDTVVESTGGSTGTSLALQCAARGFPLHIVIADAFSLEKRNHMRALGAELTVIPSNDGELTKELLETSVATARRLSEAHGWLFTNQLENEDQVGGYLPLGEEIWEQTGGRIDAFVHSVGSSGSLRGTATSLRRHHPDLHVVAVEPAESAVLSGGPSGAHKIEGMGLGYTPPLWDPSVANEVEPVRTEDAKSMARRLARELGIFSGTSTGANLVAALRVAERLGPEATVVTLVIDSGLKYLSTDLFG